MKEMNKYIADNCSIIVNSCDKYKDIWALFFSCLHEQWPECTVDIYLNTESESFEYKDLKLIKIENENRESMAWGGRFIDVLHLITHKYAICLYDDFLIESKVDISQINSCIHWMEDYDDIAVFYFFNNIGKNIKDDLFNGFELIGKRNDYKLNSAPALWRIEKLISLTGENDDPWAWECFGTARTYTLTDRFYCTEKNNEHIFDYKHELGGGIRRGKWVSSVVSPLIKKYNLNINLNERGISSELLSKDKYSLHWKVNFIIMGFKMVGFKAFIFIIRAIKSKLKI
ncbi:hypothetical protein A6E05_10125 [Aliivibrio sp. 1S165]|uniref:hypothetical protein n=1 Tax=unclassified Aliivibrio TaxID=2645654 RepID=UPI00080DA5F4|nr:MULTISPECIES: hypothetical protein [unclassified Aliivibrio]OCH11921.1 hypothetical protein A6E05_10125 [Aliivibrio sp. 1S165]OCH35847.1 hypothetical protein A6E06_10855 [Aliivibrio sp. 1S175]